MTFTRYKQNVKRKSTFERSRKQRNNKQVKKIQPKVFVTTLNTNKS